MPTPRHYHNPPPTASTRVRCPVCHEAVYSRAEMHPQCAVRATERLDPNAKSAAAPPPAARPAMALEPGGVEADEARAATEPATP